MLKPATPDNEAARLASLDSLDLLYTPAEERFDRITRMAGRLLDTPIALVTFVADKVQWFKSAQGLEAPETPREISFCGHAILNDETFVVENAADDARFSDNPLVTGDPNIRFYAGHPIYASDGNPVGTVCIIDRKPRAFSEADRATLRDLAALVETELQREQMNDTHRALIADRDELARKASIDGLTRLWNRDAIMELLAMEVSRASRGKPLSIAMIDVDNFKAINDRYGHVAGDQILANVATHLRGGVRDFDAIGRYGGDEFIAVLSDCKTDAAAAAFDRIRRSIESSAVETAKEKITVTVSIGVASNAASFASVQAFIEAADKALYVAKKGGRNRLALAGEEQHAQPPGMTSWRQRKRW